MGKQPTIKWLKFLEAVAECGYFGKAAKACQSTLSEGIQRLGDILGAPVPGELLFFNNIRQLVLTPPIDQY